MLPLVFMNVFESKQCWIERRNSRLKFADLLWFLLGCLWIANGPTLVEFYLVICVFIKGLYGQMCLDSGTIGKTLIRRFNAHSKYLSLIWFVCKFLSCLLRYFLVTLNKPNPNSYPFFLFASTVRNCKGKKSAEVLLQLISKFSKPISFGLISASYLPSNF
jgi:hypothetical protein